MAVILTAQGTMTWVVPENGETFDLKELQHHVGGYIERVPDPDRNLKGLVMLADEEGKLKRQPLFNAAASLIMRQNLVGTVLILTHKEFGD